MSARKRETATERRKRKEREYKLAVLRTLGQWVAVSLNLVILYRVFR